MLPKQQEMDDVIKSIYDIVADQDAKQLKADANAKGTLIVLCGDHGMNDVSISPPSHFVISILCTYAQRV